MTTGPVCVDEYKLLVHPRIAGHGPTCCWVDEVHPERLALIGVSEKSRVLYAVFAELADDVVRIITARKATTHERRRYEEGE